ncbi:hypothetical protein LXA43DRAFT_730304 [Ganoderma leucocontextum]|nr:hypothetical protein LXA43DRAFT_730304 [Ganoderma leucocontextum]
MSYVLHRPPSPPPPQDEDPLHTALHAAWRPFDPNPLLPPPPELVPRLPNTRDRQDMPHKEKMDKHPHLDIHVNSDVLCLRGTGVDVHPALLSGNVVLHLTEPTSIKQITLQFRGKARLPVSPTEPLSLSSSQLTYVVCNHEWSFLEGDRHHAHTLKAGRHLFPFQLQIGGSLPSSIYTSALGGASVQYKLRAQVVRGGFGLTNRDLAANHPVTIMRGFGSEALEYQQTLEIENTWPEKLMYSIMIPHKAWAASEKLSAVVKFQPLVKGARVLHVTTTINETVKLWARTGCQENTRVIASTKHDIVEGKAICVDEQQHRFRTPLIGHGHSHSHSNDHVRRYSASTTSTPGQSQVHHANGNSYFPPAPASTFSGSQSPSGSHTPAELPPLTTTTTRSSSSSGGGAQSSTSSSPEGSAQPSANSSSIHLPPQAGPSSQPLEEAEVSTDVVTTLNITVPLVATPSHSLEPIQVSHRVRWSILIANLDGHTSELRCSLPIHVLDARLAEEARVATLTTRRLLLGATDVDGGEAVIGSGDELEPDAESLPSYPAHVRDRVANAYLPDAATMRVANAWVVNGISPTIPLVTSETSSGGASPAAHAYETWQVGPGHCNERPPPRSEHLPHEPSEEGSAPLEWVNTELLLSLGREAPEAPILQNQVQSQSQRTTPPSRTPPEQQSGRASRHGSRFPSRHGSRANSRTTSPERSRSSTELSSSEGRPEGETFVHGHSTASRNVHGLFQIAMRPFTSLTSTFARSGSHANLAALAAGTPPSGTQTPREGMDGGAAPVVMTTQEMLHHAFTQVPDYDMASRGFLGGGIIPLSSLRDLPTYESVAGAGARGSIGAGERSFSEGDLAGMFAAHRLGPRVGRSALGRVPPSSSMGATVAPAAAVTP